MFIWERQSVNAYRHEQELGERQMEKQTSHWADGPTRSSIPGFRDYDLNQRQIFKQLSHPGTLFPQPFIQNSIQAFYFLIYKIKIMVRKLHLKMYSKVLWQSVIDIGHHYSFTVFREWKNHIFFRWMIYGLNWEVLFLSSRKRYEKGIQNVIF